MMKCQPKSKINEINPIAHQYNKNVENYNKTLNKYNTLLAHTMTQSRRYKATRLIIKLMKLELKIDDLGRLLETDYD